MPTNQPPHILCVNVCDNDVHDDYHLHHGTHLYGISKFNTNHNFVSVVVVATAANISTDVLKVLA